jgi:DNA-binding NtrC family response regulator
MATNRPSILIVDDEKNIRLTLSHTLEDMGFATATAVNGEDALKQVLAHDFSLVLLDLRMPGIDGMAVLREIAQQRPHTRVVMVTAHGTIENAVEALKLGAVDYIQKPFSPQEIRDLVTRVLDRARLNEARITDYATGLELAKRSINERRFADAIDRLGKAIALDWSRPEAFNLLAVLYEIQGNHSLALKNYRIALDLDPDYEPARRNLDRSSGLPGNRPRSFDLG